MNTRNYSFDIIKSILMILVIYAHIPLIKGLLNYGVSSLKIEESVWFLTKGIYAFHMPLFVFISGLFTKKKKLYDTIKSSTKFIQIFLIFQIIDLFLIYSIDNDIAFYKITTPGFALWYLVCLVLWRVLFSLIPSSINKNIIITISFSVSIFIGFIPISGLFGLHRFFSFLPYFCIGFYSQDYILKEIQHIATIIFRNKKIVPCIIIAFLISFYISTINEYWLRIMLSPYSECVDCLYRFIYINSSVIL